MPHENDESFARPSLNGSGAAPLSPSRLPDLLRRLGLDQEHREDIPDLARVLADLDAVEWYRRAAAVRRLADFGEQAPLDALLKALNDLHVSVRANAVSALARLGTRAPVERLTEALLGDSDWQVRESAACALETLGARSPVEPLLAALHDPDSSVRSAVQRTLSHVYPDLPFADQPTASSERADSQEPVQQNLPPVRPRLRYVASPMDSANRHLYEKEESMPDNDFSPEISASTNDRKSVLEPPRRRKRTWRVVSLSIAAAVVIINLLAWSILTHALRNGTPPSQVGTGASTPTSTSTHTTPAGSPGKTIFVYPPVGTPYAGDYMSIGWSSNGKYLALSGEVPIQILNASNGKMVNSFGQYSGSAWLSWAPHGTRLVVSSWDVQIWDAVTGKSLITYTPRGAQSSVQGAHGSPLMQFSGGNIIYNSAWSPDGKLIASTVDGNAYGYNVQIWNASTGAYVRTLQLKASTSANDFITRVGWSFDGKYLAASSVNNSVTVWNAATGQRVYTKQGASVMDWAPNSDLLATSDSAGQIQVWQAATGAVQFSFRGQDGAPASSLAWSPNGQYIAVGGKDVHIWDVTHNKLFYVYTGHGNHQNFSVNGLAWSPDSTKIASMGVGIEITTPHTGIPLDSVRVWTV